MIQYKRGTICKPNRFKPLIENGGGHIINIGSIAGKSVYPNGNVYCATKFAVDALSKGMMMDFNQKNIKVSQVCPGAVETEFSKVRFKGDEKRASAVYEGFKPLTASDIADVILYIVKAPAHVNISDVVILPAAQASATLFIGNRVKPTCFTEYLIQLCLRF